MICLFTTVSVASARHTALFVISIESTGIAPPWLTKRGRSYLGLTKPILELTISS